LTESASEDTRRTRWVVLSVSTPVASFYG